MADEFDRRKFLGMMGAGASALAASNLAQAQPDSDGNPPNFIIIFTDDMGYGDLSCYGHPTIQTPRLDQMAEEGAKLTSFYAAAPVCSPSRAALNTGRYPVRCGMPGNTGPGSDRHLPLSEITLAQALKQKDYRTMCIGKWHLGHAKDEYFPLARGFDQFYGLPYSNDMRKPWVNTNVPLKLYRNNEPIEHPVNQDTLTKRYTREAVKFIKESAGSPFFLYLPHSMPHLPVHASDRFRGTSEAGLYGDVIEELDWSTGRILDALKEAGVDDNTLVVFTSDNGPWLNLPDRMLQEGNERWHAGSPGPLRGAKATTYEGGMRVPMIARWPGEIPAGHLTSELATTMDMFPTLCRLAEVDLPDDRTIDGNDIMPLLRGEEESSPNDRFYYFRGRRLEAVRDDTWKLRQPGKNKEPELYHIERDVAEAYNIADAHPEIVSRMQKRMERFRGDVKKK